MWSENRTHGDLFADTPKLGSALFYDSLPFEPPSGVPIGLSPDEHISDSRYVLSGPQREILLNDSGYHRTNDAILKKRDLLAERIHHLIYDTALLGASPYMSSESWETGPVNRKDKLSEFTEIHSELQRRSGSGEDLDGEKIITDVLSQEGPDQKDREIEYYNTPFASPEELWEALISTPQTHLSVGDTQLSPSNQSESAKLGFEIGNAIKTIMHDQDAQNEVVWGFILAFIGRPFNEFTDEKGELTELITKVEQMHESREQDANIMTEYHESEYSGELYNSVTIEEVEDSGLNPNPIILREIGHHTAEDLDFPESHRRNVQNIIAKIREKVPLNEIDDFAHTVETDVDIISTRGTKEFDSISEALSNLWIEYDSGHGRKQSSDDLTGGLGVTKGAITEALHLVSKDTPRADIVTQRPLVKKTSSERTPLWELTQYGRAVCKTKFDYDELNWLYRYAIGPEELSLNERILISRCLDELGYVVESPPSE